ncbi:alpha/beta hydrolase [Solirubrobacter ginsenosidimutans]|uniref:Alpha/beta hydrolase n=1 Tax=Solirubrobacter ginsenosidimutans TaxID=490573 RepID=A0A9X3N2N4_9ACTN|nr:alpha/beta hydrolase [Solirubrobacter ginsenosidimutans]MDA0167172.1 alpha/beta hydrolase [Solirubrobacter ginsenosidimutans]
MTVLFLHGVAGSRRTYDWLPDAIAGQAVMRVDFRGHGAAARTPGAYLIRDYANDAVEVLREIGPAFVVGHSLGGVAAWWAAQLVPELVLGAVLEDPPLYLGSAEGHASNGAIPHFRHLHEISPAWQAEGVAEPVAAQRLAEEAYGPDPSRSMRSVATSEALAARAYALLHLDPSVLDTVIDGTLLAATDVAAPMTVPMTIIAADDALGAAFTSAHEARLSLSHPHVSVERVRGAGHSIHDERAHRDTYLAEVTAFLAKRTST